MSQEMSPQQRQIIKQGYNLFMTTMRMGAKLSLNVDDEAKKIISSTAKELGVSEDFIVGVFNELVKYEKNQK